MASSGKEKKREGTSLEDQNAAAIQCIVDAKMSTQNTYEVSQSDQLQSNVCPSMPTSTAARSGILLHAPCELPAPHFLATNGSSQVVPITIPGPQSVNSAVKDHLSTVIMCGNDGIIPQFITVAHPDTCEYVGVVILNCLLLNDLVKTMHEIKSV